MKTRSRKTALIISLLLAGMINAVRSATADTSYPDDAIWQDFRFRFSLITSTGVVDVQILQDSKVVKIKKTKMFYEILGTGKSLLRFRLERTKWDNPCTTPIEVRREKYGKTKIQFHTKDGKPGKSKVYKPESLTYELDLCMPKSSKTVRVAEYKYDSPNKLLRKLDTAYYDACGNALFKTSEKYNYSNDRTEANLMDIDEGCIGINDEGTVLLLTHHRKLAYLSPEDDLLNPNLIHIGLPTFKTYLNDNFFAIRRSPEVIKNTSYAFSPGSKYACLTVNDMYITGTGSRAPMLISCLDVSHTTYQNIILGGNIWDVSVNDDGAVTAKYMDKSDKNLTPGQIYMVRFQLPIVNYLKR